MADCTLTEIINIEKFLCEFQNDNGFDEPKWDDKYYRCWAAFKGIKGSEFIDAKATNSENIVTFTVRYCNKTKELLDPGASKKFRIKYNEYYYNVVFVSDYNNLHDWIDIKAIIIN
ncbi:MAG: phage head closure protein [Clostridium sp.]|uniref:phage head closure protein n=1 Tax=Clostridium sp. TaxID=1506 RepID=UPI003F2E9E6B